jgi:tetratricopeptide (TPR) repeat protein
MTKVQNGSNDKPDIPNDDRSDQENTLEQNNGSKFIDDLKRNWQYILIAYLLVFFLLVVYARNVFPALPAAMGGGLPSVIQISVKNNENFDEFIHLGIKPDDTKPKMTRQITLIAQTSTNFIMLVSNPELKQDVAVSIPKEHIDSIIYYPEEYFINDDYVAEKKTQEGQDLLMLEDYESALFKFREALDRIEEFSPAKIGMGDAYIAMYLSKNFQCKNCWKEAINYYKEAIFKGDEPMSLRGHTPEKKAEIFYKLARAYALSSPDIEEIDLIYSCDLSKESDGLKMLHPDQVAIEMLICADEQDKLAENPMGYIELAKIDDAFHQNRADIRMMVSFLELLYGSKEEGVHAYRQEANRLRGEGRLEEALLWYTWAIELITDESLDIKYPIEDQARLYCNRASVYQVLFEQKSVICNEEDCEGNAISDYKISISLDPNQPTYFTELADAYRILLRLDDAEAAYKQVTEAGITNFSNFAPAWLGLGEHLFIEEGIYSG